MLLVSWMFVNFGLFTSQSFLFILLSNYAYLLQPPQSFLTTMEEYIREAPRVVTVPNEPLVSHCFITS